MLMIIGAVSFTIAQVVADFEDGTTGPLTLHVQGCGDYDNDAIHPVDETFMVIDNPDASGINTSSKVLKFIRRGTDNGGQPWGGFWANVDPNIDVTTNKYAHVMVWKPMISPLKFKLEGSPTLETASMNVQSDAGMWVDIVFDFSTLTGNYAVMSLMPDFQDPFATAEDVDLYIDNIQFTSDPNPIGGSITGMIADFENGTTGPLTLHVQGCGDYDNDAIHPVDETFMVIDNPDASGINTSSKVLKFIRRGTDNGGQPWGGFWANVDPNIDVTVNQYAHVMVWKPMISPLKFKMEGTPTLETASMNVQSDVGMWVDIVFDFSTLTGDYAVISLMPDFADPFATAGDVDIYIDNIQYTNDPTPIGGGVDITGTWKMSPQAAALGVGPALGDISWWSNTEADVVTRACYFDDEYVFSEDGTFQNVQQDETWIEEWQGSNPPLCGTPVAPHDGSNAATWVYDEAGGTITLNGVGAYLGLPKVINGAELSADPPPPVPDSIVYLVEFNATNDTMTINIEIQGGAYYRFILTTNAAAPPAPTVTFNVNMSYQVTLGNFDPETEFVDISGNFNDWPPTGTTTNELTEGPAYVYSTTIEDFTVGEELEFKFRINSDWDNAELFDEPNRTYTVIEGLNEITVWYNNDVPPPPGMLADFENDTWGVLTPHVMGCGEYDNDALHPVDETFMIIDNPDPSGINQSSKVLKFIRRGTDNGGQPWGGFWAQVTPPVNTTETKYVHYMVWKPMVSPLKFKLEGATIVEVFSTNEQTATSGWQDMVFNFSEAEAADYGVVALMPDFTDPFETAEDVDIYIDNIVINSNPNPISGIWDNKAENEISMYPNPFTTSININLTREMNSIVISNVIGQQLYKIENVAKGPINIDASTLDSGVYIVTFTDTNNKTTSAKLLKD